MAGEAEHPVCWVTEHLGVGSAPMSYAALDSLRAQGVRAILNLCAEFSDLHGIEAAHGFEVYHLPIPDEEAPDLAELEKALDWLDEAIYLGKKVFIHCRHGIGRTGTVLNAYILRRGLGHRRAWLTLRPLRSQPANFRQWRMVRRYGKSAVPLTVRKPTLERSCGLDLSPFVADHAALVRQAEAAMPPGEAPRCGRGHARCCAEPFTITLAEAVRLNDGLGASLTREERAGALERAAGPAGETTPPCPLLLDGDCLAYDLRPLRCRTFDLPEDARAALWEQTLTPGLDALSRALYQALTGQFMPEGFPRFSVADAIAGRHVRAFFDWQKARRSAPA